jgi:hypothetical protein
VGWSKVAPLIVTLAVALVGCASSTSSGGGSGAASQDSMGDPYIADAQGRAIKVGMEASAAFRSLGGKSPSGYNGAQAVPPLSYDYPIQGTGNPDDVTDDKTIWWQICVKNGRVSGKVRGHLGSLPEQC